MQHTPPETSSPPQELLNNHSQPARPGGDPDWPVWSVLAHILRPQGRKGEVLAELHTDLPQQFECGKRVFLAKEGFAGARNEARAVEVGSYFLPVGRNAGRIVLHFKEVSSIEAAEALAGLDVLVPSSELPDLDEDASYVADLVGCALFDRVGDSPASQVGIVSGVQFAATPDGTRRLEEAAPLLVVEGHDGAEILVPFVKAFLVSLDVSARRIEMALPPGLLEINRAG